MTDKQVQEVIALLRANAADARGKYAAGDGARHDSYYRGMADGIEQSLRAVLTVALAAVLD